MWKNIIKSWELSHILLWRILLRRMLLWRICPMRTVSYITVENMPYVNSSWLSDSGPLRKPLDGFYFITITSNHYFKLIVLSFMHVVTLCIFSFESNTRWTAIYMITSINNQRLFGSVYFCLKSNSDPPK